MMSAGPFRAQNAPARPEGRRQGEGAGVHAAQGAHSARWPVEATEIGLQYVIPGCERRTPHREHSERGAR